MNCTRYVVLGPLLMTVCLGLDAWGSESKAISGALDLLKLGPGYSTSCQDYLELTNDHKLDLIRNVNSQGLKHRIIKHLSLNIPLQCRLSSDVTFETISSLAREFPKLTYDVIRNSRYQQQWEDYGTLMKPEARHDFLEVFQIEKAISSKKCRRQIPATECIGLLLTEAWSHPSKARTYPDLSELLKTISNPNQINTIPDWSIASENIVSVLNLLTKRLVRSSPIDKLEFIQQNQHSLRHVTKHNLAPFSQQTELICGSLRDVFKLRASSPFLISQIEAIAFAQTVFCSKASLVHETQNYLLDAISLGENPAKDRKMNQIIDRNAFGIDFDAESRSALLQKTIASGINRRLESQVLLFQNAIEYGSYSNTRLLSRLLGERQEFYRYLLAHQSDIHRPMADIRRLRELSTRMSQEMESFFFVKEAIHNQFGPGIKSLVREYRNKHLLSFSAEFTKSYDELEALLAELFTEAKNQALMVSNARSSQCCEGLLGLLDGSEELGQRIDDMEANWETMATQQNSDHLTNNYQDYFTLHQNLLKQIGLHSPETIMAKIPDFDDRLLSHLNRLFGLNADSFESFSDALRHMYQRESIPFQWLLAAKAYRAKLGNDELKFQLFNRARFLVSPIIENELRHIGIHYLAKFFEKERSGIRILNKGISRGLVTFVDASDLKRHAYHTQQILVTNGMPNNLGTVAALVTTVPQPIGSHIDLRTKENGIPNAYINDAYKRLKVWDGKWIRLDLTQG
ncbi:MAG: hypothetical protein HRU19_07255, partial [Pseudobacteriovorax sp.]|nr:hypothetical protein [Pseudobacteriovorax sp.]